MSETKPLKIFLIAGEASGDLYASQVMRALKNMHPDIIFYGIGGPEMLKEGLNVVSGYEFLGVIGVFDIIRQFWSYYKLVQDTVDAIFKLDVDLILTLDCWSFNHAIGKRLKARGALFPHFHFVAPAVWAWNSGRAHKAARVFDKLFCLFPFEVPYFEKHHLKTEFVGHPLVHEITTPLFETKKCDRLQLIVMFGSRRREIKLLSPLFAQAMKELFLEKEFDLIIPTFPEYIDTIQKHLENFQGKVTYAQSFKERGEVIRDADIALCASGTVTTELTLKGIPSVVCYKMGPISFMIACRIVKLKFISLTNIILDRPALPELLQNQCHPTGIKRSINALIDQYLVIRKAKNQLKITYSDSWQQVSQGLRLKLESDHQITPCQTVATKVLEEIL